MALFTADTHFVVYMNAKDPTPYMDLHTREALAPVFDDLNKYAATTHFVGQSTIFTLTGTQATGETYCLAHHVTVDSGKRRIMIASLRYLDKFVKANGQWLFAERLLYVDWRKSARFHDDKRRQKANGYRGRDRNGRRIRAPLRARERGSWSVTAIGRAKVGISHRKPKEVLHRDFADCSALTGALSGQDAVIFCLGAYTGSVSNSELRKITVDYTIAFARALRGSSPDAAFAFLSGNGADPTGRSRMPFARYKGEAEKALLAAGFPRVYLFRPAYIYPVDPRREPNFNYRLLRAIYPAFRVLFPNQVIPADDLARAMVDVALRDRGEHLELVLENRDIRALVEPLQLTTD